MFIHVHTTGLQVDSSPGGAAVKEGGQVTLTCKTTCNLAGSPSFIWSKDGRPVEKKRQSTSNQLQLHPVSREDKGNYTCAVRGHEKLPSPPFRLKVHCLQTVQTDKDKVKEGNIVTLTCNTTCPLGGSTTFIWRKDGLRVQKKQITNNQLQLHPVTYKDNGSYTCAVTGHEGLPSPPLVLTFLCQTFVTPATDKVKEGDDVTLTCNTTCPLGGSTSFIWSKNGGPVEEKRQSTSNQLQLHPVSRGDAGSYTCAVRGHDASSEPFVLKVKESHSHTLLIGVLALVVFCVLVGLLCIICRCRQPKASATENSRAQRKVDQGRAARPHYAEATGGAEVDAQYSTIHPKGSRGTRAQEEDEEDDDDVQYASIQFKKGNKRRPEVQKEVGMMLSTPASSPDS
ncbi:hypothetical protein ACEWY4_017275 [Coilia grayii]|uniref:Ig-like domain-containing protein n=1 Tax=Coilia grayii TaxID=363190 RepID=A0ABD1JGD5_9TELE